MNLLLEGYDGLKEQKRRCTPGLGAGDVATIPPQGA